MKQIRVKGPAAFYAQLYRRGKNYPNIHIKLNTDSFTRINRVGFLIAQTQEDRFL